MRIKKALGVTMVGVGYPFLAFGGLALHLWTVYLAFTISGLFSAFVTLAAVGLAEILWFFGMWYRDGFWTPYCLFASGYFASFFLVAGGAQLVEESAVEDAKNPGA